MTYAHPRRQQLLAIGSTLRALAETLPPVRHNETDVAVSVLTDALGELVTIVQGMAIVMDHRLPDGDQAPAFKIGDRVVWTTVRSPRVGGMATPVEVHGEILGLDSVAAFCREDGASTGHDSVSFSALKHEDHEEEAEEARTMAEAAAPDALRLTAEQRAFAAAAVAFVWDNEGSPLPSGEVIAEADLDDMLAKLRDQHDPDCECDACMAEVIAEAEPAEASEAVLLRARERALVRYAICCVGGFGADVMVNLGMPPSAAELRDLFNKFEETDDGE